MALIAGQQQAKMNESKRTGRFCIAYVTDRLIDGNIRGTLSVARSRSRQPRPNRRHLYQESSMLRSVSRATSRQAAARRRYLRIFSYRTKSPFRNPNARSATGSSVSPQFAPHLDARVWRRTLPICNSHRRSRGSSFFTVDWRRAIAA